MKNVSESSSTEPKRWLPTAEFTALYGRNPRDSALQNLSTQFSAILRMSGMDKDRHGKPRTLYSLRHTAIVRSLRKGVPIELIASNARTSTDMIRRFYGTHVDSVLETGTVYVEKERAIRDKRFEALNKLIADMKEVSDTPEIYTYNAASLVAEGDEAFRRELAQVRDSRPSHPDNKEGGAIDFSFSTNPEKPPRRRARKMKPSA